jgi:hypothetical protein
MKVDRNIRTHRVGSTESTRELIDLGLKDGRGRSIGVLVYRWEEDWADVEPVATSWSFVPAGHYLTVLVRAARDGKGFGALQSPFRAKTGAEREAHIAKRIAGTRKRYAAIFAQDGLGFAR